MKVFITLLLVLSTFLVVSNANALTLAERGKATATIIVGSDATAPEKTAANELADYLKQITGLIFRYHRQWISNTRIISILA